MQPKTSVFNLTKLIGLLSSTVQAILPAQIRFRYPQIGANITFTEKWVLRWSCDAEEFSQGGIPLVDGKLETLQWEENSATRTLYDHSGRCLNKRLGAYCKRISRGREMVIGGEAFSHKCSRITSIKICSFKFHKEFVTLDHSFDCMFLSCHVRV